MTNYPCPVCDRTFTSKDNYEKHECLRKKDSFSVSEDEGVVEALKRLEVYVLGIEERVKLILAYVKDYKDSNSEKNN